jgi:hypothetical protein
MGKTEIIFVKSGTKQECPLSPFLFNIVQGFLGKATRQEEEIKIIHIGKEILQVSPFEDDMILYLKYPTNLTQTHLDNLNSFSNVTRYKFNLQKSVSFPYTKNEQIGKQHRKTTPFIIASKKSHT